jgi:hypothetical protein
MTGFMEATEGDAIIKGCNIKTDMNKIYNFMVGPSSSTPACEPRVSFRSCFHEKVSCSHASKGLICAGGVPAA